MGYLHDTSRKLTAKDVVGKTISAIDHQASNVLYFEFTDGTFIELWAEIASFGIPVMEVDPNAEKRPSLVKRIKKALTIPSPLK